jgi:serine/threonine protein kinase
MQQAPNYDLIKELGSGCFGIVYLAKDKATGRQVAIKRVEKKGELVSRESQILHNLNNCENCINLLDFFYTRDDKETLTQNMVFEYMPTNLEDFLQSQIKKKKRIPEETIKIMMFQILNGIKELHAKSIAHRDLKPENILMNNNCLKIADFGSSKIMSGQVRSTPYIVSRYYRAPELLLCITDYCPKIDIWAAGCIFVELACMSPAFKGKGDGSQILAILSILGSFTRKEKQYFTERSSFKNDLISKLPKFKQDKKTIESWFDGFKEEKEALNVALKLLSYDPRDRPSANDAINMPFFDSVRNTKNKLKSLF